MHDATGEPAVEASGFWHCVKKMCLHVCSPMLLMKILCVEQEAEKKILKEGMSLLWAGPP